MKSLEKRDSDAFSWNPQNDESLAGVSLRVDRVLGTHHESCSDGTCICVCHGEIMWVVRIRLECLTQQEFIRLDESKHPHDHIHNCQILTIHEEMSWDVSTPTWYACALFVLGTQISPVISGSRLNVRASAMKICSKWQVRRHE